MIAQWIISLGLLCLALYAASQRGHAPIVALAIVVIVVAGLFVVWAPETSTYVANLIGISRGSDLILYVFILSALAAILNIHLRLRSVHIVITDLARTVALQSAQSPDQENA